MSKWLTWEAQVLISGHRNEDWLERSDQARAGYWPEEESDDCDQGCGGQDNLHSLVAPAAVCFDQSLVLPVEWELIIR